MKAYHFFIPPCGIFCGACPVFVRQRKPCPGAATRCRQRKCRTFYVCCIEERGLRFCHQCSTIPCSKFKKFANNWLKYGQDMFENQRLLAERGEVGCLDYWNVGGCASEFTEKKKGVFNAKTGE